jgi:hypothetical protein
MHRDRQPTAVGTNFENGADDDAAPGSIKVVFALHHVASLGVYPSWLAGEVAGTDKVVIAVHRAPWVAMQPGTVARECQ